MNSEIRNKIRTKWKGLVTDLIYHCNVLVMININTNIAPTQYGFNVTITKASCDFVAVGKIMGKFWRPRKMHFPTCLQNFPTIFPIVTIGINIYQSWSNFNTFECFQKCYILSYTVTPQLLHLLHWHSTCHSHSSIPYLVHTFVFELFLTKKMHFPMCLQNFPMIFPTVTAGFLRRSYLPNCPANGGHCPAPQNAPLITMPQAPHNAPNHFICSPKPKFSHTENDLSAILIYVCKACFSKNFISGGFRRKQVAH